MTVDEAAQILRVKKSWIYAHTRLPGAERLPHTRIGRYVRFSNEDLDEIQKRWTHSSSSAPTFG